MSYSDCESCGYPVLVPKTHIHGVRVMCAICSRVPSSIHKPIRRVISPTTFNRMQLPLLPEEFPVETFAESDAMQIDSSSHDEELIHIISDTEEDDTKTEHEDDTAYIRPPLVTVNAITTASVPTGTTDLMEELEKNYQESDKTLVKIRTLLNNKLADATTTPSTLPQHPVDVSSPSEPTDDIPSSTADTADTVPTPPPPSPRQEHIASLEREIIHLKELQKKMEFLATQDAAYLSQANKLDIAHATHWKIGNNYRRVIEKIDELASCTCDPEHPLHKRVKISLTVYSKAPDNPDTAEFSFITCASVVKQLFHAHRDEMYARNCDNYVADNITPQEIFAHRLQPYKLPDAAEEAFKRRRGGWSHAEYYRGLTQSDPGFTKPKRIKGKNAPRRKLSKADGIPFPPFAEW